MKVNSGNETQEYYNIRPQEYGDKIKTKIGKKMNVDKKQIQIYKNIAFNISIYSMSLYIRVFWFDKKKNNKF